MPKNRVHGDNYGVMVGTVNGEVNVHGSDVHVNDATTDDGDTANVVHGDNYGLMTGTVNGGINFYE